MKEYCVKVKILLVPNEVRIKMIYQIDRVLLRV